MSRSLNPCGEFDLTNDDKSAKSSFDPVFEEGETTSEMSGR